MSQRPLLGELLETLTRAKGGPGSVHHVGLRPERFTFSEDALDVSPQGGGDTTPPSRVFITARTPFKLFQT